VPKTYELPKHFSAVQLGSIIPKAEIRRQEISLLEVNSKRYWVLCNIKKEKEEGRVLMYRGLVVTAKDHRGETVVRLLKFQINVSILLFKHRKVQKGEDIYVKVEHVDPFYDTLVLEEVKYVPRVSERKQIQKVAKMMEPPEELKFPALPAPHSLLGTKLPNQ